LATRFLDRGNEVIVCGRSKDILDQLVSQHPQIQIRVCDIALRKERESPRKMVNYGVSVAQRTGQ
jgi:short-subunit dehydrogenase involved in D-alanine esterification of teichoic acids